MSDLRDVINRLEGVVADLRTADVTGAATPSRPGPAGPVTGPVTGLWTGRVMEADTNQAMVQVHQTGNRLIGSIVVYYDDPDEPYLACQEAEGEVDGDRVTLRGTRVTFIPADPEAEYGLDVFEMRLVNEGREMNGRWTDADGDADGRVALRRAFE